MPISFATVPLLMEDTSGHADKFIRRYLEAPGCLLNHPRRTLDIKSRVQRPLWPNEPRLKANMLYIPTGATRWSKFIGLATTAQKDQILSIVGTPYATGTLTFTPSVNTPSVSISSGNTIDGTFNPMQPISTVMYLLPPVPVSSNGMGPNPCTCGTATWTSNGRIWQVTSNSCSSGSPQMPTQDPVAAGNGATATTCCCPQVVGSGGNTLWLIPLVDARYWNSQTSLVWNGGSGSYASGWAGLLSAISSVMGMMIPRDTTTDIASTYGVPDNCFFANGLIDASAALDMMAWSTGQRLVVKNAGESNPDKKFLLRSSATAPTLYLSQSNTLFNAGAMSAGGNYSGLDNGDVPSILEFHFTNDGATDTLNYPQPYSNVPAWAEGLARDFMCPANATGSNNATLQSMADLWCADWWQWTKYRFQWGMPGIIDWHFTGFEDFVIYDMSRRAKGGYNCRTLVRSMPPSWGWDVVPMQISGVTRSCGCASGASDVWFRIVTPDCESRTAIATVIGVSCGASSPSLGETITLCDVMQCFLVGEAELLTNRIGWCQAVSFSSDVSTCAAYYDSDSCPYAIKGLQPPDFNCS